MDFRRVFTLIKLLQLVFGLITFGLYMNYNGNASVMYGADSSSEAFVRSSIGSTAVAGYPFVIILLTVVAYLLSGESIEGTLLNFLFSIVGFGLYLITGSLLAHSWNEYGASDGLKATVFLVFITCCVYLYEMILGIQARCR